MNNVSDVSMDVKTTECDIVDVIYAAGTTTIVDNMDSDAISVSSDITFGTDQDKSITKKYKKMSIEKLREECVEKSLNRGLETKRYIRITTNRSGFKKYIDTKTRKTYQIDVSKFSIPTNCSKLEI